MLKDVCHRIVSRLSRAGLITAGAIVFGSLVFNVVVNIRKTGIERDISAYLGQPVTLRNILYFPPHYFILNDISFKPPFGRDASLFFNRARKVKIFFSLARFIFRGDFGITKVYIDRPVITFNNYGNFFFENIQNRLSGYAATETEDFSVVLKNALFISGGNNFVKVPVDVAFEKSRNNLISSYGRVKLDKFFDFGTGNKPSAKDNFLEFSFSGYRTKDGISIENLEFKKNYFYAKFWGAFQRDTLRLNGVLSLNNLVAAISFPGKLYGAIGGFGETSTPHPYLSNKKSFDIFDFDGSAKIDGKTITLEKLTFSLNGIPYGLRGVISGDKVCLLDFKFSSYPAQRCIQGAENLNIFDLGVLGAVRSGKFSGKVYCDFFPKPDCRDFTRLIVRFRDLSPGVNLLTGVRLYFPEAKISYRSGKNISGIFLKDFMAAADPGTGNFKFSSYLYDGFLRAKGMLGFNQGLFIKSCDAVVRGVDAGKLINLSPHLKGLCGECDAAVVYNNYSSPFLKGDFFMPHGRIKGVNFFNWLSDFFILPPLKNIVFDRLSAKFTIKDKTVNIAKIKLNSPDVKLGGSFSVNAEGLVSSRLLLLLSKNILSVSPKFRPLFGLINKNSDFLDFDFQLSGSYEAMNFKWLESDFKKKLRALLPAMIEHNVERQIKELVAKIGK